MEWGVAISWQLLGLHVSGRIGTVKLGFHGNLVLVKLSHIYVIFIIFSLICLFEKVYFDFFFLILKM